MNNDGKYNICIDICPCEECDCDEEDCVLAQAYQKQKPKKPHHMYRVLGEYELFGECPHCGHSGLRQGFHQCCWWCGQKLDWRNEDEQARDYSTT